MVTGAGDFIGGHLVPNLIKKKYKVICADIKPIKKWFHVFKKTKKYSLDLKNYSNCLKIKKILTKYLISPVIWEEWAL